MSNGENKSIESPGEKPAFEVSFYEVKDGEGANVNMADGFWFSFAKSDTPADTEVAVYGPYATLEDATTGARQLYASILMTLIKAGVLPSDADIAKIGE